MSTVLTLCEARAILFFGGAYELLGLLEGLENFRIDIKRVFLLSPLNSKLEAKLLAFLFEGLNALTQEFDALFKLERVLIPIVKVLVTLDLFKV